MPKKSTPPALPQLLVIEQQPLASIILPAQSLKRHPERQIEQLADSIRRFGFNDPIALDEAGTILEGHGRLLAAQRLGLSEVPVIHLVHLSPAEKRAYRIAHNKICQNSDFDLDLLRQEFEAIKALDLELVNFTGFEEAELSDLLADPVLPELSPELNESILDNHTVTCPHCGGTVYVN
jgi:ParB-like chromosome segregation protein Spo0J